jgi:hypothetical protein
MPDPLVLPAFDAVKLTFRLNLQRHDALGPRFVLALGHPAVFGCLVSTLKRTWLQHQASTLLCSRRWVPSGRKSQWSSGGQRAPGLKFHEEKDVFELLAERWRKLVASGQTLAQGDLGEWRFSEVRTLSSAGAR